jgi:PAS domain S-box-containing protein
MPKTDSTTNKQSIRLNKYEFLALFLPVAALVVIVGISFASLRTDARVQNIIDYDGARLNLISGFIGAEVSGSLKHLRSLANEAVTRQALDSRNPDQFWALESSFMTLAKRNPHYQQIRWIDETGAEQVRVMRDRGEPFVVGRQQLQDKSSRYYFKVSNELVPGELYISRIDLNVEEGQVEAPLRTILRIATSVEDSSRQRRGILVINIEMKHLFNLVQNPGQSDLEADYLLVNQQGMQLNGRIDNSQSVEEQMQSVDFARSHKAIWEGLLESESGSMELKDGLWTWQTLTPTDAMNTLTWMFKQNLTAFDELISGDFSLTLVAHRPLGTLLDMRSEIRMLVSLGVVFSLAVYAISLLLYMSSHVRVRRAEVEAAYANARASSLERMKELEQRFHRLVEASSIGQLVVDQDGRIEICNPAAEHMLGYETGELGGASVESLLPARLQERHVREREQFMQASEARKMGKGRELAAVRKDGSLLPVEIGLNPYTDHGRQLVLVSIVDVSERGSNQ